MEMADVKEFLNPKSMLPPGVAGAVAMMIANSLWVAFGLPQAWAALLVSFLFGILAVAATPAPMWQRTIYCVLNSFVIFAMGWGGNAATRDALRPQNVRQSSGFEFKLSTAYAQPASPPRQEQDLARQREELERREQDLRRREQELLRKEEQRK